MKWSLTRSGHYERVDRITPALQAREKITDISFDLKGLLLETFYLTPLHSLLKAINKLEGLISCSCL